ncbi:uncharacterized protein BX664DRAFT_309976 [Halteromyces radiatus]|uniref:uncharacterized protein n=1 Tax=Halteromyces radiatus TaxID=101107 RepID=UPI00222055A3|nr:uncharacterized protein BX664DRAFT_309976 [Halteromyces radiatus]KAI8098956.1 hypothetical protein BX664DRAFT_309976 [Halteromyces radiatus]
MDASQCCVVVVTDSENSDESLSLLHTVFSFVTFVPSHPDVLGILQAHYSSKGDEMSTLVLLDDNAYSGETLLDTLDSIRYAMNNGSLQNVAPIVYSSCCSTDFMVKCLDHGACDYIIKPLRQEVVNTLFLNIVRSARRHRQESQRQRSASSLKSIESGESKGTNWKAFQKRLQSVFQVNSNLIHQSVSEYFIRDANISRSQLNKLSSETNARLRSQLSSWHFAPFDFDHYELMQCVFILLNHVLEMPELQHISFSDDELYDFIFDVANMYQSLNPYHNFQHAVDVMQATYYFLCQIGVLLPMDTGASPSIDFKTPPGQYDWFKDNGNMKSLFSSYDILALILASIGHDVGHPGVNNIFMIRTATPLALMYNDRSVLESFHAMVFFNILQRHCFQPLTEWQTTAEYTRFRKIIVQSILATDMGLHDDYVNKIQAQKTRLDLQPVDVKDQEQAENEIILICGSLIKCADISNCARPFPVAKKWAEILQQEFHEQGDLEKELGLSVLPINDRGKISLEDFQLGFKKNVAGKLFDAVANVLPDMSFAVKVIQDNCIIWESRKEKAHDSGVGGEAASSLSSSIYEMSDIRHPPSLQALEQSDDIEAGISTQTLRGTPLDTSSLGQSNSDIQTFEEREQPSSTIRGNMRRRIKSFCQCVLQ